MAVSGSAQLNVQLHYDLGRACYGTDLNNRQKLTATVENFTADKWGSTYFFVDADFGDNVMRSAYTEFSREIQTKAMPVALHVEYNGGLSYGSGNGDGYAYNDAYLAGVAYNWNSADFSKGFSIQALYKYMAKCEPYCNSWQVTAVWRANFAKGLCTCSGYVDLWHDNTVNGNLIVQSETKDVGGAKEEIPCYYEGEPNVIAVNSKHLEEPLKFMTEERVKISFSDGMKAMILSPEPASDYFHVMMPMQKD